MVVVSCELNLGAGQDRRCSAKARMTAIVWRPSRKLASTMTGRRGKVSAALHLSARYVQIVHQCFRRFLLNTRLEESREGRTSSKKNDKVFRIRREGYFSCRFTLMMRPRYFLSLLHACTHLRRLIFNLTLTHSLFYLLSATPYY